jgi:hypothetical protein
MLLSFDGSLIAAHTAAVLPSGAPRSGDVACARSLDTPVVSQVGAASAAAGSVDSAAAFEPFGCARADTIWRGDVDERVVASASSGWMIASVVDGEGEIRLIRTGTGILL